MTCSKCNAELFEGDVFCRECGTPLVAPQDMPTLWANAGIVEAVHGARDTRVEQPVPTMVVTTQPQGHAPATQSTAPVTRSFFVPLLIAAVLLAVVAGGALTYIIVSKDKTGSGQDAVNRRAETPINPSDQPTDNKPATTVNQPKPVTTPEGAMWFAYSTYDGVNIRSAPSQEADLLTTIGKGRGMWVFEVSDEVDTVFIKSANRDVTDNWCLIQLADDQSVRGWVFGGFLTKE